MPFDPNILGEFWNICEHTARSFYSIHGHDPEACAQKQHELKNLRCKLEETQAEISSLIRMEEASEEEQKSRCCKLFSLSAIRNELEHDVLELSCQLGIITKLQTA